MTHRADSTPLRVGLDLTPAAVGITGIARYSRALWEELQKRPDITTAAFAAGRGGRAESGVRRVPVPVRFLDAAWRRLKWPTAEVLLGDVDVVHNIDLAAPPTRRPLVMTWHDTFRLSSADYHSPRALAVRACRITALDRAAAVVTTCHATASELTKATGFPSERIVVAPPGFAVSHGSSHTPVPDRFVLAAGAITPRKGFDVLARAMQMLGPHAPPLVIAGPMGYRGDVVLRAVTDALDSDRLHLLGDCYDQMDSLYRSATIVCHPSLAEGFGLVCLEAMGSGAAVIAADIPSIREMADGCVRLVPPGDARALAEALADLLADDAERERLSALGRARAASYTWESMAARCVEAYRIASGSRASKP